MKGEVQWESLALYGALYGEAACWRWNISVCGVGGVGGVGGVVRKV